MAATKKISPETLAVLASMEVDGCIARITEGQLDRKRYEDVNKALAAIGGKWNRGKKGHVFEGDPRDALDQIVLTGEYTNKKQQFQFFETPEGLADELVAAAGVKDGMVVLEPSAGRGRIVRAIKSAAPGCKLYAVEIDAYNIIRLASIDFQGNRPQLFHLDFMSPSFLVDNFIKEHVRVDACVMNPPFNKRQDVDHVTRAFSLLRPGGRLVSVVSGMAVHRTDTKGREFAALVARCGSYRDLPEGTFKESGTMVRAGVVMLDKE
jgi:predicted RNA methylase